jgi:hypothetical protein
MLVSTNWLQIMPASAHAGRAGADATQYPVPTLPASTVLQGLLVYFGMKD